MIFLLDVNVLIALIDSYLLDLAASKVGQLATFDRRMSPGTVRGGTAALHVIA